jgi:hypothetical protein
VNTTMEQKVWHETTVSNFPSLVDKYCTELGISKVPTPEYVSPDTALFYRRNKAGDYESVIAPCGIQGLFSAMSKGWLMVAPDKVETPFETPTSSALGESDLQVDAAVATEQLAYALEQREKRDEIKQRKYGCPAKGCRKRFTTKAGMLRHNTMIHAKEKIK